MKISFQILNAKNKKTLVYPNAASRSPREKSLKFKCYLQLSSRLGQLRLLSTQQKENCRNKGAYIDVYEYRYSQVGECGKWILRSWDKDGDFGEV